MQAHWQKSQITGKAWVEINCHENQFKLSCKLHKISGFSAASEKLAKSGLGKRAAQSG